jgi:hypothetical protein
VTASEDHLDSLRDSAERIATALNTLATRVVTDARLAGAVERVQGEVRQANAVGQFTVLSLVARLKEMFPQERADGETANSPVATEPAAATPTSPACVPEYDNLSAAQIVPLLRALTPTERAEVLTYETSTRQRKTIIAALGTSPS